ncbi:MAG TPA: hypothetical protein VMV02_08095, partial [Acidimicrobiales bacterium]|nr:hypothetical protein [Acidimicrobiales bacterium]
MAKFLNARSKHVLAHVARFECVHVALKRLFGLSQFCDSRSDLLLMSPHSSDSIGIPRDKRPL